MEIRGSFPAYSIEIDTLLFDLDGTLVRMNRSWIEAALMLKAMLRFVDIIPPWRLPGAFWRALIFSKRHQSTQVNFSVFLETFAKRAHCDVAEAERRFRMVVDHDLPKMARYFSPVPQARETILLARELGYRIVIATNPSIPHKTVTLRLEWAGLGDMIFDFVTSAENMTRCKPNPDFYHELLRKLGLPGRRCLMIGDDVIKDVPAREAGILTFILDGPAFREQANDPHRDPRLEGWGTYRELQAWLKQSAEKRQASLPAHATRAGMEGGASKE